MTQSLLRLFLLLCLTGLFSCQKEIGTETATRSENTRDTYLPLTAGTTWTFKDSATGTLTTGIVTNVRKNINNRPFVAVVNKESRASTDTAYYSNADHNYFMFGSGVSPNSGAAFSILFHLLNDTAAVNSSWRYDAGHGNGFTAWFTTTIIARNITETVEGRTYQNVMHTQMNLEYDVLGMQLDYGVYQVYMAKGVGVIRTRFELQNLGMDLGITTSLVSYEVK